ncbi:Ig-like domain-containing protein [Rouxiella badensis]|uniref:Ig-like domain-containing protein n=1 Tax=Rouxiella badensis TaxID=1646377 RepID=UPI001B521722|nr:Ig-like domain-containing protein [Rouxiella badensis]MCC3745897.1 Ig-like domain-containing protein [Rouxiella badensis]WAT06993.1 Ig-like domain-containing protein [Rouxiella badensis]
MANTLTLTRVTNGAQADGSSTNSYQVIVTNSSTGAAVASSTVTLSVTTGATLSSTSVTTNSSGVANGTVTSTTAGSFVITASQTGATSTTVAVLFTTAQETAAAQRVLETMQSALGATTGSGYVGYDGSISYSSGTIGAAFNTGGTQLSTNTTKLARYIDIEDYADTAAASGDWTTAIQAAIDGAVSKGILEVRGTGSYAISGTIKIRNIFSYGLNISIHSLSTTSSFPTSTTFWNATPMITIGDSLSNITGLNLFINVLNGGGVADGIAGTGYGFALSHIHVGNASNCIAVVREGSHQWPNASNWITGDYWTSNYMGIFLKSGTTGTNPIVEGWKIFVKFIASNYWGGVWFFDSGQYAQVSGDWDFNGKRLAVLELSSSTGLSSIIGQTGLKLTDGTTPLEFLFYYTNEGNTYVVVASTVDISAVSGSAFPWTTGATISCTTVTGVALAYTSVNVCGDNTSATNYFDILHDFERAAFAKIQITAGYLSGIIGGLLYTSNIQYQNSFDSLTDSDHGLSVGNSGTTLSLYNTTVESVPFMSTTTDYVNFAKKLYMKDYLYEGVGSANTYASSTSTTSVLALLTDSSNNKYLSEGTMYDITLKTNYAGTCGSYRVFVIYSGGAYSHVVVSTYSGSAISITFTDTTSGVQMNFRQEAQTYMQVVTNVVRI